MVLSERYPVQNGPDPLTLRKDEELDPLSIDHELTTEFCYSYEDNIRTILAGKNILPADGKVFCIPHMHNEGRSVEDYSDMIYVGDYYVGNSEGTHRILISYGRRDKKSSRHLHHGIYEWYIPTGGKAKLIVNDINEVKLEEEYMVHPESWHQVVTEDDPVLLIIYMKGAGDIPEEKQHDHGSKASLKSF